MLYIIKSFSKTLLINNLQSIYIDDKRQSLFELCLALFPAWHHLHGIVYKCRYSYYFINIVRFKTEDLNQNFSPVAHIIESTHAARTSLKLDVCNIGLYLHNLIKNNIQLLYLMHIFIMIVMPFSKATVRLPKACCRVQIMYVLECFFHSKYLSVISMSNMIECI